MSGSFTSKFEDLDASVACHEFLVKPLGALYAMNRGIPIEHKPFWNSMTVDSPMQGYLRSILTAASVLKIITEPTMSNAAQATTFSFLMQYIGNMKKDELREFLRFVTGSSALIVDEIQLTFNGTAGIFRAPWPIHVALYWNCLLHMPRI